MKNWNKPEISTIDIKETAGGILDVDYEGQYTWLGSVFLGDKRNSTPDSPCDHKS